MKTIKTVSTVYNNGGDVFALGGEVDILFALYCKKIATEHPTRRVTPKGIKIKVLRCEYIDNTGVKYNKAYAIMR